MVTWLDGFTRIGLAVTAGRPYDEMSHPKICLHTTEGSSIEGAESAFTNYPPHVCVDYRSRRRHQYLPLDTCSYSLKGSESDDEYVVQVEIVGFATRPPGPDECDWLGAEVIAPIAAAIGCPLVPAPQGFHGGDEGIVPYISSALSPIRFKDEAALRAFSGVMGHQHAPPPDTHWDPGPIDIHRILTAAAEGEDDMPYTEAQLKALVRSVLDEGTAFGQVSWAGTCKEQLKAIQAVYNAVIAGTQADKVQAAEILNAVAGQLSPEAVAAAIPDGIAEDVANALVARLSQ